MDEPRPDHVPHAVPSAPLVHPSSAFEARRAARRRRGLVTFHASVDVLTLSSTDRRRVHDRLADTIVVDT